jgi:Tol biopolymer transport system component
MYPQRRMVSQALGLGLVVTLVVLALSACGGQEANNESESGGSAPTDGQIVFRRYLDPDQTKGAIFTMNPDGSHVSQITPSLNGWSDETPVWSPDGTKVAFYRVCLAHCYGSRIIVVDANTGDTRKVTHCMPDEGWTKEHPSPSSERYCAGDSEPAFSPDGKSVAFRRILGPEDLCCIIEGIWIVRSDGSNPHQVTNVEPERMERLEAEDAPKLSQTFSDYGSAFSPNGKMLVFDRVWRGQEAPKLVQLGEEEPYYHAVFVQSLDSSGKPEDARQITPWEMNCQDHPEYSPDAKLVLFRCLPEGEDGPSNLYWVHPDGTGLHQLTHSPTSDEQYYLGSSFSPSFSEEEGWITAGRQPGYGEDDNADVFRLLIKDGEVVRSVNLTKSAIWDSGPVWGTHPPVG